MPAWPSTCTASALATFRMGEHGQAVLDFLDFMAKYPKHPLVANAQYWIGEAYYVQHDYRQAQTEFQKVLDIAPGSAKAADALLKIGYCQLNLRDAVARACDVAAGRARVPAERGGRQGPHAAERARKLGQPVAYRPRRIGGVGVGGYTPTSAHHAHAHHPSVPDRCAVSGAAGRHPVAADRWPCAARSCRATRWRSPSWGRAPRRRTASRWLNRWRPSWHREG